MKQQQSQQLFDDIAPTYDTLNHTLSLHIDKLWRRRLLKTVLRFQQGQIPGLSLCVLDLATGTGDVAIALARHGCSVIGMDPSAGMLIEAVEKSVRVEQRLGWKLDLKFGRDSAERLHFLDESFDAATIAFGIRNFEDRGAALREILRVLEPDGHLVILEFSPVKNPLIRFYTHRILPFIGGLISKNRRAYEYLPASVDDFPNAEQFKKELRQAGFRHAISRSQTFGIAQLYVAFK